MADVAQHSRGGGLGSERWVTGCRNLAWTTRLALSHRFALSGNSYPGLCNAHLLACTASKLHVTCRNSISLTSLEGLSMTSSVGRSRGILHPLALRRSTIPNSGPHPDTTSLERENSSSWVAHHGARSNLDTGFERRSTPSRPHTDDRPSSTMRAVRQAKRDSPLFLPPA